MACIMTWDLINACAILNVPLSGNLEYYLHDVYSGCNLFGVGVESLQSLARRDNVLAGAFR